MHSVMSTNENAINAYQHLDKDEKSPLHRLYRLQNFMQVLRMALHSNEALGDFNHEEMFVLQSCAGYIVEDANDLSGSFEEIGRAHV